MNKPQRISPEGAFGLYEALRVTAGNIRSLGPAGALDLVPIPYREWLAVVEGALAKARGEPLTAKEPRQEAG